MPTTGKGPFPSPYANAIWATMKDGPVPSTNIHELAGITVDECQRGLNWLAHFKKCDYFVEFGRAMIGRKADV